MGGGPTIVAAEIAPATDNAVPEKIDALFAQYDTNGDGVISEEELTSSLDKAFPEMKQWARDHIPVQFAKYASGEPKGLDKPRFTKLYAAFLFRYFDESGDGELQVAECERALKFLAGKDTAVACPPGDSAGVVSKLDFWLSARGITDRTRRPAMPSPRHAPRPVTRRHRSCASAVRRAQCSRA